MRKAKQFKAAHLLLIPGFYCCGYWSKQYKFFIYKNGVEGEVSDGLRLGTILYNLGDFHPNILIEAILIK